VIDAVTHFQTGDTRETPPNRFAAATLVVIGKADLAHQARQGQLIDGVVVGRGVEDQGGIDAAAHRLHEHPVAPGALVELLEDPPRGAYRLKGRVRVHGSPGCMVTDRHPIRADGVPICHQPRWPGRLEALSAAQPLTSRARRTASPHPR
jgi:hypothetical protein